jgi:cytoskeletal protein CcmA (bactofilin family)
MFKKSEPDLSKLTGSPPPPVPRALSNGLARASTGNAPSVIGPNLTIKGELISKGELQINGEVQGNIWGTRVVIGEHARTAGDIIAEEIVIRGHVMGTVRGRVVTLQSTSHVEGDIFHKAFAIEHGATFEGTSRHVEDPLAGPAGADIPLNGSSEPGS